MSKKKVLLSSIIIKKYYYQEVFRTQNLCMLCRNSSAFPLQSMVETPLYVPLLSHGIEENVSGFPLSWTGQKSLLKMNANDYKV